MAFSVSCSENEIEFNTSTISSDLAEYQLHYTVPVTGTSSNYIYKVEVNDKLVSNSTAPLSTYSAIPDGSVGRFYTVDPGTVNIKLYKGSALDLVYDKNVTLSSGKQNIFVYDFNEDPIVFDNGYPYTTNLTEDSDSTCWVKFYNFLYETAGVPTTLKLQYQYIDPVTNKLVNIGNPVSFAESTGWQPVKIIKEDANYNSAGYRKIYFRIKVVEADGSYVSDLQIINTATSVYSNYSDYWNCYIGRRYHHVVGGFRSAAPIAAVKQFAAL